ncbi:Endoribonuclease L-PSP [Shewanella psychrophila]|uniref:Endoribonuclease L-PSP n=1 Tax=Shewanella psychrophila TaxID=225848 RepID=A0A1S6HS04_9GAMM|nr:Endoribonuclease L-PSP [Shewanella psychrophila]
MLFLNKREVTESTFLLRIYIKDMQYFAEMNAVWDAWVPEGHAPARACVAAKMARDVLLVEISVVAAEKV